MRSRPQCPFPRRLTAQKGFTLLEVVIVSVVLLILSTMTLRSMFGFNEQRKLRTAAVELSGYLQVARNVARAENGPCTLALSGTGESLSYSSQSGNSCKAGSLPPSVQLRAISGGRDVQARFESGAQTITFTPEGTITTGDTLLISSANVPTGLWCVDVQAPLATIRLGWRPKGEQACNFAIEQ